MVIKDALDIAQPARFRYNAGSKRHFFAGNFLYPAEGFLAGIAEVVRYHDVVARLNKLAFDAQRTIRRD